MEEFALMARESEKAMLQDLRERLGVYVTIVKKTEDERDNLRDKLAQAGQQSERDTAALQARIDKLEGDLDAVQAELNRLRRREGALRQHQEGEREAHEETRKLLEDARKRAEAAERRATEAEAAEDKILNELEGVRAQLDARNKAYEELDRNKDEAVKKLMGKKDEQLQAAHRGWVSETDAKLTDIQKRLHDEHQKEVQALERDLLNRTRDLKKQSDSHAKVVTLLHEKIKVLDKRYKENYALWEKKVSEVTAQRDEYYQAKEEYQNKYHRLINPKIMCDAELRHLKHMLDAEEKRLDIPIRVTGAPRSVGEEAEQDSGTTHDEHSITSDDASFTVRKTKEVGEPDGVVITGVHLDEKRVVIENRGSDDVDMTQWTIKLEFADQREESFSLPSHYAFLKKGATMTIRVAEEGTGKRKRTAAEREETDLVWLYSGQNWAEESYCKATLLDEKGEDVYTYIMGPNERVTDLPSRASAQAKAFAVPITPEKALPTRSTSRRGTHQDSPRAKECRLS